MKKVEDLKHWTTERRKLVDVGVNIVKSVQRLGLFKDVRRGHV